MTIQVIKQALTDELILTQSEMYEQVGDDQEWYSGKIEGLRIAITKLTIEENKSE